MNRRISRLISKVLLLAAFVFTCPPVDTAIASTTNIHDGTVLDFTVMRKGEEIGTHVIKFSRSADQVSVDIKTDVEVKLLFVPVYHFYHEGREVWQGDRLSKLVSTTDDDGVKHALSVEGTTSALKISGNGTVSTAPSATIPASLWHPELTRPGSANVLNTLDGHLMAVEATFRGEEEIPVRSELMLAKHYTISGELERDLWYDPDGLLVKVQFKGSDGSEIEYVLK